MRYTVNNWKRVFTSPFGHVRIKSGWILWDVALQKETPVNNYIIIEETYITTAIDEVRSCSNIASNVFPAFPKKLCRQNLAKPFQRLLQSYLQELYILKRCKKSLYFISTMVYEEERSNNYRSTSSHISKSWTESFKRFHLFFYFILS